jgi:lipopolysaccharide transport system ATP-binding protein
MSPIISVENLGKRYTISHQAGRTTGRYRRLSEELVDAVMAPFRALASRLRGDRALSLGEDQQSNEDFWALRNVSFEVKEGEVLGIIGRNGAGKSTLLKVLSRITEPSEGRVRIRGRVASLLEVGTGFHPELTGRENIYLNGAILGMTRAEIRRKFDEIVAFAEVEKFLDTPVKRYSSGMYVRLAFAVAAHLEPEVLVVDEVLAVGDADFQKKCLRKMGAVASSGRTVLFVSHNLGAIRTLCQRSLLLDRGRTAMIGGVIGVIERYMQGFNGEERGTAISPTQHVRGDGRVLITNVQVSAASGESQQAFLIGESFKLTFRYQVRTPTLCAFWFFLQNSDGVVVTSCFQKDNCALVLIREDGEMRLRMPSLYLQPGRYVVSAGIMNSTPEMVDWVDGAVEFQVLPQFVTGLAFDQRYGLVSHQSAWEVIESHSDRAQVAPQ